MDADLLQLAEVMRDGLRDGLVWMPIILAVGLLYRYLRIIDVSVDGGAIAAGLAAALGWNHTQSYAASITAATLTGAAYYAVTGTIVLWLRVSPLLAGLLMSLVVHAFSILVAGESMVLRGANLFGSYTRLSPGLFILPAAAWLGTNAFFHTALGTRVRAAGDNDLANLGCDAKPLRFLAYLVSGLLVGLGSAVYVHNEGVARSGGGFDFLVNSLCGYIVFERLVRWLASGAAHGAARGWRSSLYGVLTSPPTLALLGGVLFQTLALLMLASVPVPVLWKAALSVVLLGSLASWSPARGRGGYRTNGDGSLSVHDLWAGYEAPSGVKWVLLGVTADFPVGLTALVGPNGGGKSTLLAAIAGRLEQQRGEVRLPRHAVGKVFVLAQDPLACLAPDLTAAENIALVAPAAWSWRLRSNTARVAAAVDKAFAEIGMKSPAPDCHSAFWQQRTADLSGGQAQLLALMAAVASHPRLLLADEPTSALDRDRHHLALEVLNALSQTRIVVVATHDPLLREGAARIYTVCEGRSIREPNGLIGTGLERAVAE